MMPLGAPSISKYGSLVRPDAQIVALRAYCARTALGAPPKVAHMWAGWLHKPCRLGGAPLRSREHNQRWRTSGPGGCIIPTASGVPPASQRGGRTTSGPLVGRVAALSLLPRGVPTASERGRELKVAHKWAGWLHNPCCLGGPHRLGAGSKITSGPQVGRVAALSLPPGGSPPLLSGVAESQVAHKWAGWLHYPCCLGVSPPRQSGGYNQRWPTSGPGGYITPAA